MVRRAISTTLLSLGLWCGCGGEGTPSSPDAGGPGCQAADGGPRILSNNSAELDGPCIGWGTTSNDALRKPIRIDLLQPDPRFSAGPAYALRETVTDPSIEIAFMVTNLSSTNMCFVRLADLRITDAMGADITATLILEPYVEGSVLVLNGSLWTYPCLMPGESGWALYIVGSSAGTNLFAPVAAIEFQYSPGTFTFPIETPPARVIPDGYTVSGDGVETVRFTNTGTGPATVSDRGFSKFVALDDAGDPLFWDYVTFDTQPVGPLQPGESGSASTGYSTSWRGTAHRMRPFIDFRKPPISAQLLSPTEPHAKARSRAAWNALENEHRARQHEQLL